MEPLKFLIGDIVLPPGDDRPWRIIDMYEAPATGQRKALLEFLGEAWVFFKVVPADDLRMPEA